jgi:phosphatidylserine decarboxylase
MTPLCYVDRASGEWRRERVHAQRFLDWLYNTRSGRLATGVLVRSPHFSRLHGWLQRRRWSRRRIRPFVEGMGVDMTGSVKSLDEFETFADFFTRRLHSWARPIDGDEGVCVSPADGRVLVYPRLDRGERFRIKRATFQLDGLLRDEALAEPFHGGSMAVVRLGLADYHHVHFPDSGVPSPPRAIPGTYHAGGPYALRHLVPFYTENHRMVTSFASDHFGAMAIVEVGALTVGSIRQAYSPDTPVGRGEHKAGFEPGGSTVVLLFRPGAIEWDDDLVARSRQELEVHVRWGDSLGRVPEGRTS